MRRRAAAGSVAPGAPRRSGPARSAASSAALSVGPVGDEDALDAALEQARDDGPRRAAGAEHEGGRDAGAPSRRRGYASRWARKPEDIGVVAAEARRPRARAC